MMLETLLVVDDEPQILQVVSGILQDEGFEVLTAPDGETALNLVAAKIPDLVLLDIALPGLDGLEVLNELKRQHPLLPVIMISAYGSVENAVKATRLGAYDFIEKPPNADKILLSVRNGLELVRLAEENRRLRQQSSRAKEIIGESLAIRRLREKLALVAPTNAAVLIIGDNGTGKELVARALHVQSRRAHHAFVEVNCAAIPEDLIESELFGHEKGAFTGASARHRGKFDLAHEGTLFLDEIGDMSLKTQAKILRILEEQRFERVGGSRPIQVDVRVVAATNKNLEEEIAQGRFREDLYHRINVIPLVVPPLRERREDIPLLAAHFLQELSREGDAPAKTFSDAALTALTALPWPGNVRELRNAIERAVLLSSDDRIGQALLPLKLAASPTEPQVGDLVSLDKIEESHIRQVLAATRSFEEAAKILGLDPVTLWRRRKKYGI
jgi:two-component system nitrogen regulation response regulator NtrX